MGYCKMVDRGATIPTPSDSTNPGSVEKDSNREVLRCTGRSVLNESLLVDIGTIHYEEGNNPRTGGQHVEEGSDNGPTSLESPPGPEGIVLDLFRFTTTERPRFGAALALQILTTAEFKLSNFIVWFTRMSKDKRRKRLTHGGCCTNIARMNI
jgi:hypothetical protein